MDTDYSIAATGRALKYLDGLSATGHTGRTDTAVTAMVMALADFVQALHWYMDADDMTAADVAFGKLLSGSGCGDVDIDADISSVLVPPVQVTGFSVLRGMQDDGTLRSDGIIPRRV